MYSTINLEAVTFDSVFRDTWSNLYARNYVDSPFCSLEWCCSWWKHLGLNHSEGALDSSVKAVIVRRSGEVVGIAPFYTRRYSLGNLSLRALRPLGVLGARFEDLTEEPILLMDRSDPNGIRKAIEGFLLDKIGRHFDATQIHYVGPLHNTPNGLDSRWRTLEVPMLSLYLKDDWDSFWQSISSSSRESIARKPRLLAKQCKKWYVEKCDDTQLLEGVRDLVRLHRKRARSAKEERADHLPSKIDRLFLEDVIQTLHSAGKASIWRLFADGKVVAAQIVLDSNQESLLYYSGYDPEWSKCSPTVILQTAIFRDLIERKISRVRLHRFPQEWKHRWGATIDETFVQKISVRKSPLSLLRLWLYANDRESRDQVEPVDFE